LSQQNHGNWAIYILPYMEQDALYSQYNDEGGLDYPFSHTPDTTNQNAVNQAACSKNLDIYTCPSDINKGRLDLIPESGPGSALSQFYRTGSYRAVSGRLGVNNQANFDSNEAQTLAGGAGNDPLTGQPWGATWRGPLHFICRNPGSVCDGIVRQLKVESTATILDGTANTLMVGEYTTFTHPRRTTFWAYSYTSYNQSSVSLQTRTLLANYDRCVAIGGPANDHPCKRAWGSFHAGPVLNFAMCDGSVRSFGITISMPILAQLATVAGGEAVSLPNSF
jgi:prepilin-type processing-associated H-X9-DG protein